MAPRKLLLKRLTKILSLLLLTLMLVVMLFPLATVTINSFKTDDEYRANGPLSLPESLNADGIMSVWNLLDYPRKLLNSVIISLVTAVLTVALSLVSAFALGIGKVRGRWAFLMFFILAITLPQEVLVYPLYYFFKLIGLYNTYWAVIVTFTVLNSAFGIYLMTSVFSAFPAEIIEAAIIDGCDKLGILVRIVMPLSMPTLSVLFVFVFIWTWNEFFLPLIFLPSNTVQTVPLAMAMARSQYGTGVTTQSIAAMLGIAPCIFFFLLFQRTLTHGITLGSVK